MKAKRKLKATKKDLFAQVSERLIEQMEKAQGDWRKPFIPAGFAMPTNAKTKKEYQGGNAFFLGMMGGGEWATYRQWEELGAQVRKGEKSTMGIYWATRKKTDKETGEEIDGLLMIPCAFHVFSADQVDGYTGTHESLKDRKPVEKHREADRIVKATGAAIRHQQQDRAFYAPASDYIGMPDKRQFSSREDYYSVLLHELTHWTGHKSRLNRFDTVSGSHDREEYAKEELVAEIGAAFLLARCGLSVQPREDHAEYLACWIKHCKSDPRAFYNAATKAQKAVDFILGRQSQEQAA